MLGADGENTNAGTLAAINENEFDPIFKMLHRFMFRFPVMVVAAKLLTVNELSVVLFVTARELRVVTPCRDALYNTTSELTVAVPVVLSAPETVTLEPAAGANTILLLAVIWRLLPALMAMEPRGRI